jgi:hypothetical protein
MPVAVVTPPKPLPVASLTFSPLHLVLPLFELTAEFRAGQNVGVALLGGAGSITEKSTNTTFGVYEVGGQFRFYVLGDFRRGLDLGLEVLYMKLSGDIDRVAGTAQGIAIGPFIGYKLGTMAGFVFDAQIGVERVGIAASAHDAATGQQDSASDSKWIPLLNLNVGWSF